MYMYASRTRIEHYASSAWNRQYSNECKVYHSRATITRVQKPARTYHTIFLNCGVLDFLYWIACVKHPICTPFEEKTLTRSLYSVNYTRFLSLINITLIPLLINQWPIDQKSKRTKKPFWKFESIVETRSLIQVPKYDGVQIKRIL